MFTKLQYRKKVIKTIFLYAKGVRPYYLLLGICMLLTVGLEFWKPSFYKLFLDEVILEGRFFVMSRVIFGYLAIFIGNALVGYLKKYSEFRFSQSVLCKVKKAIFRGYFATNFGKEVVMDGGEMKMRLDDDTAVIKEYVTNQSLQYAISLIKMFGCMVLLFETDWRLALFSMAVIPMTFRLDDAISRREKILNQEDRENTRELTNWLQTTISGWREVRALQLSRSQKKTYISFLHKKANYFAKWINYWTARCLVIPRIKDEFLMRFGLYFVGGLLIAKKAMTISELLVFMVYYGMMSGAMKQVSKADANLQANMPKSDRFMEQLERTEEQLYCKRQEKDCPEKFSGIHLERVTFSYEKTDVPVFKDFSLDILPGERVAIVGKSGIGKTTLLKLMTGMELPTKGIILYSGVNTEEIDTDKMYGQIGFVMQENILFHMSIRENLQYGKSNATKEEMIVACKKAHIWEFIVGLPEGLDTIVGEKGMKLSGGQRQRLVLARLFLQDVQVYIFDEATSALDAHNETLVQESLKTIAKEKTIIVVAHRESSIKLCQRVVKLA